ncbi:MAG: site-2 protease family protein [Planctomycetota bacterium]|nr:site-2 protease family protein [Planctomycetota bacterium]
MLFSEPPQTPLDFDFQILGIPVRVSGLFWILPLVFGIQMGHPFFILASSIAIFTGVLVHELGHALVMRRYGISPRIALTMMGGYATENQMNIWNLPGSSSSQRRTPKQQIMISAAGPFAGFLLAGLVIGLVFIAGGWIDFRFAYNVIPTWQIQLVAGTPFLREFPGLVTSPSNKDLIHALISFSLFVNIYWGILNLLPVYPLDGGQISRELMVMKDPHQGFRNSLWLSVMTGAILAFLGLMVLRAPFMGILFAVFAYQSYQMIQNLDGKGFGRGPW